MNIYEGIISKSTPQELAELIEGMSKEITMYREAFYAAKAFIDSHVADPDITEEMIRAHHKYLEASKGI